MVQLGPVQEEEIDVVVRKQPGRQVCTNIKESRAHALKELPDGFYICEAGRSKAKCLHRIGILLVPGVDYFVYSCKGPLMPQDDEYEEVCKQRCSAALFTPMPQDSGSDSDPSTDID